jgi:anti-anti-sigma factor
MDDPALTIKTVRHGPVCVLALHGELDIFEAAGFLEEAARSIDDRTERLVVDLAGLTFLDCAGVRALSMAMSLAPPGCPVIIRSLSPEACRILDLLDLDLESLRKRVTAAEPGDVLQDWAASQPERGPSGAGQPEA